MLSKRILASATATILALGMSVAGVGAAYATEASITDAPTTEVDPTFVATELFTTLAPVADEPVAAESDPVGPTTPLIDASLAYYYAKVDAGEPAAFRNSKDQTLFGSVLGKTDFLNPLEFKIPAEVCGPGYGIHLDLIRYTEGKFTIPQTIKQQTTPFSDAKVLVKAKHVEAPDCPIVVPEQPPTTVALGAWAIVSKVKCGDTSVAETRQVTTTTFALVKNEWVGTSVVTTETQKRDLTAQEIADMDAKFQYSWNGAGGFTVTVTREGCSTGETLNVSSYTLDQSAANTSTQFGAGNPTSFPQTLFAHGESIILPDRTERLSAGEKFETKVLIPPCVDYQSDLYTGTVLNIVGPGGHHSGDNKFLAGGIVLQLECSLPEPRIDYGVWVASEFTCGDTKVTETRTVSTTTYALNVNGQPVAGEPVVGQPETQTRDLTLEEIASLECPLITPDAVVVPAATASPDLCLTKVGSILFGGEKGIEYSVDKFDGTFGPGDKLTSLAAGDYTVTASALKGFVLKGAAEFTVTVEKAGEPCPIFGLPGDEEPVVELTGSELTAAQRPALAMTGASELASTAGVIALLLTLAGAGLVAARRRVQA